MTEEVVVELAETPAPEQEATAAPAPEVVAPEEPKAEAKTFTQEELDAAIGKRLAREQRKWEREVAQRMAEQQRPAPTNDPKPDQFQSPEEYAEALAFKKAQEMIEARERHQEQSHRLEQYHDKEEEARSKYDDFEQVAYNPRLPITNVMAETIQASEVGPDVAYYLGTNPKEADRISRLSPFLQAKEIGRIEAKIQSDPAPVKKTTSAPAPIAPVTPRNTGASVTDTTDPRSVKSMTTSEWIEAERARQRKKWEQANR